MDQNTFLNGIANNRKDIIKDILGIMEKNHIDYCVIGGLAVNAYAEPVVSLDMDMVITAGSMKKLMALVEKDYSIEHSPHSINLSSRHSDLRIQLQTDDRYQAFIPRASIREVMGYRMRVASLEDVLAGKVWAHTDKQRRGSKRQKDLADIMRMIEAHPEIKSSLPEPVIAVIDEKDQAG